MGNLSRIFNNETLYLNSFFQLGDSALENSLAVAQGFPNVSIDENQVIMPDTYAQFFGFSD